MPETPDPSSTRKAFVHIGQGPFICLCMYSFPVSPAVTNLATKKAGCLTLRAWLTIGQYVIFENVYSRAVVRLERQISMREKATWQERRA